MCSRPHCLWKHLAQLLSALWGEQNRWSQRDKGLVFLRAQVRFLVLLFIWSPGHQNGSDWAKRSMCSGVRSPAYVQIPRAPGTQWENLPTPCTTSWDPKELIHNNDWAVCQCPAYSVIWDWPCWPCPGFPFSCPLSVLLQDLENASSGMFLLCFWRPSPRGSWVFLAVMAPAWRASTWYLEFPLEISWKICHTFSRSFRLDSF